MVRALPKSRLSIKDAPRTSPQTKKRKLGLIDKRRKKMVSMRLSFDAIDKAEDIIFALKKAHGFKISLTSLIETLILDKAERPDIASISRLRRRTYK